MISNTLNTIKTIDKIHLNHLSASRSIESLLNLGNRLDTQIHEFKSNDCIRTTKVFASMKRLIILLMKSLLAFNISISSQLKMI